MHKSNVKVVKPYDLRLYGKTDWDNPDVFIQYAKCGVCGHHLPIDQVMFVSGQGYIHNDVRCYALIRARGSRLMYNKEGYD